MADTIQRKPSILILTDHFTPAWRAGGPVQSVQNIIDTFGQEYGFHVMCQARDFGDSFAWQDVKRNTWQQKPHCTVCYTDWCAMAWSKRLVKELRKATYQGVCIQSFFSWRTCILPLMLRACGVVGKHTVWLIHPRGELYPGALQHKRLKKKIWLAIVRLMLDKRMYFQATNAEEAACITRFFPQARIITAGNISATFAAQPPAKSSVTTSPTIAFYARITPKKGLHILLEALQGVKKPCHVLIIGPEEDNSHYTEELHTLYKHMPKHITAEITGGLPRSEALELLRAAHFYSLPTASENFGHSIVEAVAGGCVPLLSDQTPWNACAAHGGYIHPYANVTTLCQQLNEALTLTPGEYKRRQMDVFRYFSLHPLTQHSVEENKQLLKLFVKT